VPGPQRQPESTPATIEHSDATLLAATATGDWQAYALLVERHQVLAFRTAYGFIGDASEAQDIAQLAFLKVFQMASTYEDRGRFTAYLRRIVVRLCLDHRRRNLPVAVPDLSEVPADRSSVTVELQTRERDTAVRQALEALPPTQRLAIWLRYFENLSYLEIAEALQVTVKAAERLLANGREALLPRLRHHKDP
jgi:RNA polymerase sigma-70 factor (ECF subfamily)